MNKFELLKQVYYNSKFDRLCDGHKVIMETLSLEKQKELHIKHSDLQEYIMKGENYLYRVGIENGKFKAMYISLKSFEIIRKYYSYFEKNNNKI